MNTITSIQNEETIKMFKARKIKDCGIENHEWVKVDNPKWYDKNNPQTVCRKCALNKEWYDEEVK